MAQQHLSSALILPALPCCTRRDRLCSPCTHHQHAIERKKLPLTARRRLAIELPPPCLSGVGDNVVSALRPSRHTPQRLGPSLILTSGRCQRIWDTDIPSDNRSELLLRRENGATVNGGHGLIAVAVCHCPARQVPGARAVTRAESAAGCLRHGTGWRPVSSQSPSCPTYGTTASLGLGSVSAKRSKRAKVTTRSDEVSAVPAPPARRDTPDTPDTSHAAKLRHAGIRTNRRRTEPANEGCAYPPPGQAPSSNAVTQRSRNPLAPFLRRRRVWRHTAPRTGPLAVGSSGGVATQRSSAPPAAPTSESCAAPRPDAEVAPPTNSVSEH